MYSANEGPLATLQTSLMSALSHPWPACGWPFEPLGRWIRSDSSTPAGASCSDIQEEHRGMATGWAKEGAVQEQIDATIKDSIRRARSALADGPSLKFCAQCGTDIPQARRDAVPGVRLCLNCQSEKDRTRATFAGYNRRGSKD